MLFLVAKIRKETGSKLEALRAKGVLPGVLYGPKIKNMILEIDLKAFEKVYKEAGESSLISLGVEGEKAEQKKFSVLIHDIKIDSLNRKPFHVDFFQPDLTEEIEVAVPLVFEGTAPAVKDFSGTLVKNIHEVHIKALPENLPHEIKVNVESLKTLQNVILIEDLPVASGVKILKDAKEIVAQVAAAEKVEEELAKPVEEKVEEVEKIETKKEKEEAEEAQAE